MASAKSYSFKTIANQMVTVPVVFSLLYFPLYLGSKDFLSGKMGDDTVDLVCLLLAVGLAFFIGSIAGFMHSYSAKSKPASLKKRYVPLAFPTIYALVFIGVLLMVAQGKLHSGVWFWAVIKNPIYFPLGFLLFLTGNQVSFIIADFMGYLGFGVGYLIQELVAQDALDLGDTPTLRRRLKMGVSVLLVGGILISGALGQKVIGDGWIEIRYGELAMGNELSEFDLMRIAPFQRGKWSGSVG